MQTNRRSFFRQLAVGIVALSAPSIFIPKLIERPKWKANKWVTNPEYVSAPYECSFLVNAHAYESMQLSFVPYFADFWKEYIRNVNVP